MKFWATYIIVLLLGMGSCAGSFYLGKISNEKIFKWESAEGRVYDYTSQSGGVKKGLKIAFTYQGQPYQFTSRLTSKDLSEYLPVTVIFPKDDPSKAEARNFSELLGLPFFLWLVGLIMCVIGFFKMQNRAAGISPPDPSQMKPNPQLDGLRDFLQDRFKKKE